MVANERLGSQRVSPQYCRLISILIAPRSRIAANENLCNYSTSLWIPQASICLNVASTEHSRQRETGMNCKLTVLYASACLDLHHNIHVLHGDRQMISATLGPLQAVIGCAVVKNQCVTMESLLTSTSLHPAPQIWASGVGAFHICSRGGCSHFYKQVSPWMLFLSRSFLSPIAHMYSLTVSHHGAIQDHYDRRVWACCSETQSRSVHRLGPSQQIRSTF